MKLIISQNKAFIVSNKTMLFSHHDRPFVKENVLNYLENTFGFKICMHERDFTVGDTIPANIDAAIKHSRRMIMVISRYIFI